ncbi:MAG: DUF3566 domain-containing protein [Actinomycetaceae bacterium]|nr:DUF3566 domain-containing protein [Actinomycetaceae bacterium]MDY6082431.1 DUF3566 domain-containing protein [Actinomycetaceae bacterium]
MSEPSMPTRKPTAQRMLDPDDQAALAESAAGESASSNSNSKKTPPPPAPEAKKDAAKGANARSVPGRGEKSDRPRSTQGNSTQGMWPAAQPQESVMESASHTRGSQQKPSAKAMKNRDRVAETVGIRHVKMTISRVDPLSALKLGFLLSVALGIMIVVATVIVWFVLDSMGVFAQLNQLLTTLSSPELLKMAQYLEFGRWISFGVIIAVLNVVILTALSAIGALVYNLVSTLVGGLHITVTDI